MGNTNDLDAPTGNVYYLGYFSTEAALNAAHPTGIAGEYAIVGTTDTIWVWNSTISVWVDSSVASTSNVRIFQVGETLYLQTKIGGVWTDTGTQWDI